MKSTQPTNIFKLGVKETGQSAPAITVENVSCDRKYTRSIFAYEQNLTVSFTHVSKFTYRGTSMARTPVEP